MTGDLETRYHVTMLRLVYVGDQVLQDGTQFGFFDANRRQFIEIGGEVLFADVRDLEELLAKTSDDDLPRSKSSLVSMARARFHGTR